MDFIIPSQNFFQISGSGPMMTPSGSSPPALQAENFWRFNFFHTIFEKVTDPINFWSFLKHVTMFPYPILQRVIMIPTLGNLLFGFHHPISKFLPDLGIWHRDLGSDPAAHHPPCRRKFSRNVICE